MNTSKSHIVYDFIICVIMSGIYTLMAWKSSIEINVIFVIRHVLAFWLTIVCVRGIRLVQYIATVTVDIDLADYINPNLGRREMPFKYKWKENKEYFKKPFRRSLSIAIVLLLVNVAQIFFNIARPLYLDIVGLLLFVYITIFFFTTAEVMGGLIADFHTKYRTNLVESYTKKDIIGNIKIGLLAGILFDVCLIYFVSIPKFDYFLYFLAFSMLFSFSKILIDLYRLFSNAVYSMLGYKFESIPLRRSK